jgi:hypothetical protein
MSLAQVLLAEGEDKGAPLAGLIHQLDSTQRRRRYDDFAAGGPDTLYVVGQR